MTSRRSATTTTSLKFSTKFSMLFLFGDHGNSGGTTFSDAFITDDIDHSHPREPFTSPRITDSAHWVRHMCAGANVHQPLAPIPSPVAFHPAVSRLSCTLAEFRHVASLATLMALDSKAASILNSTRHGCHVMSFDRSPSLSIHYFPMTEPHWMTYLLIP